MTLTISRKDVPIYSIIDYPQHERFIKLPISRYLDMIGIDPIPAQIGFINAVNNPNYRFICGALARRLGKTLISNIISQLVSLIPGKNVLIMSPNYSLSEISFSEQRNLLKRFNVEVIRDNAKDRIIEVANGSTIRMGSVNQVDSCVGRSYDCILFDECALSDEGFNAFNVALRPTLDRPGSKALFISTPRGKANWFHEFYLRGFSDLYPDWVSLHADYTENPRLTARDIEDAQRTLTRAQFRQEYEASFTAFEGQIYSFNAEKCVQNLEELDISEMDIIGGIDIGFRDPTAFVIIAYDYRTEMYYILDEYLEAEKTTDQHAVVVKEMMEKWGVQAVFIDSAAQQTRYDWAYNYDIPTSNANKSVLDGIAYVQVIVEQDRLIVDHKCKNTIATLDQYRWNEKIKVSSGTEKPLHNEFVHIADGIRYAIYSYNVSIGTV